jgi:hypothetical protein
VIPHAGSDQAARAGDARHLTQPGHRIGHEVHDQLGEREVEAVIGKGQRRSHVDSGEPRTGCGDERGGRIDRRDGIHAQTLHQLGSQRAGSTADVQRPLARVRFDCDFHIDSSPVLIFRLARAIRSGTTWPVAVTVPCAGAR